MTGLEQGGLRLLGGFALLAIGASAQWLNYPTPGVPRNPDGKPNLVALAPRAAGTLAPLPFEEQPAAKTYPMTARTSVSRRIIIECCGSKGVTRTPRWGFASPARNRASTCCPPR